MSLNVTLDSESHLDAVTGVEETCPGEAALAGVAEAAPQSDRHRVAQLRLKAGGHVEAAVHLEQRRPVWTAVLLEEEAQLKVRPLAVKEHPNGGVVAAGGALARQRPRHLPALERLQQRGLQAGAQLQAQAEVAIVQPVVVIRAEELVAEQEFVESR